MLFRMSNLLFLRKNQLFRFICLQNLEGLMNCNFSDKDLSTDQSEDIIFIQKPFSIREIAHKTREALKGN